MNELPTIAIVNSDSPFGYSLINKADFDADLHEVYVEPEPPKETKSTKKSETST